MTNTSYESTKISAYKDMQFPKYKDLIKRLSLVEKLIWYSVQDQREIIYLGNNKEFKRFWYWNFVIPTKIKRIYYRIKNREIFKRYPHISEMPGYKDRRKYKPNTLGFI